jgi:hypothetical protein
MRRWQVTVVLGVLAVVGLALATGLPWLRSAPLHAPEVVRPAPAPERVEPMAIPELSEPLPVPVLSRLPPDPEPVQYGCGGRVVASDHPVPECGRG